jgi:hypothetical protein
MTIRTFFFDGKMDTLDTQVFEQPQIIGDRVVPPILPSQFSSITDE